IQRLFFNLFDNAVRAMEGKGRLLLRSSVAHWLNLAQSVRQEYVAIEVSDTGCGIPDELLGRVFDPYVTGRSGGSGLGLSICRHIIKEHGGRITLQSKVGVGTTVRVELPAYQT
ncbi:MAG: ATP-binding protein, partial [Candidatus Oleimicrobiaceae bacterium]